MPSSTKQTESIRRAKRTKRGQVRKQKLRTQGSTPKFPIHSEKAESGPK